MTCTVLVCGKTHQNHTTPIVDATLQILIEKLSFVNKIWFTVQGFIFFLPYCYSQEAGNSKVCFHEGHL